MRRTTIRLAIVAAIVALFAAPVAAKKSSAPSAKPPKTTVAKTQAPKAPKATTSTPKGKATAPKSAKASAPKSAKASAPKSAKADAPKGSGKKTAPGATTADTPTTPTTDPTTPVWTNDVSKKLSTKPNHLRKLESALGMTNLTEAQINGATSGFKNWGQFNAAMNTSINHDVDFAKLKALMTGLDMTGEKVPGQTTTYSLGQAKQQLGIADTETEPATTTTSTGPVKVNKKKNTAPPSGGTE